VFGNKANESNPVSSVSSGGQLRDLLDAIKIWFQRYIYVVDENDLDIIALWTFHTWVCEETYTTPRLLITSPVPGSGKTTVLEHLAKLARKPVQMASVSSSALLARLTAKEVRTLLLDEADRSLNPKRPGVEDLIAVLNSGYKVGSTRPVLVPGKNSWEAEEMSTFAPVAIAGNSPLLPDDTLSRCIIVRLLPATEGKIQASDWEYLDEIVSELAKEIEFTADEYREQIRHSRPNLPTGCVNRLKERWSPLKRIADVAGKEWSNRVDELIVRDIALTNEQVENSELQVSPNVQLVRDLYLIYKEETVFKSTNHLVLRLIELNPEQWSSNSYYGKDLTAQRLGRILATGFGVHSQRTGDSPRGYHSKVFDTIWVRLGISNRPTEPTEPTELTESELF
jgi:hypothetical protein